MDPDKALEQAREGLTIFRSALTFADEARGAELVVDAFESLNDHLVTGGRLPAPWRGAAGPTRGLL